MHLKIEKHHLAWSGQLLFTLALGSATLVMFLLLFESPHDACVVGAF
jgi:hypothetical protein